MIRVSKNILQINSAITWSLERIMKLYKTSTTLVTVFYSGVSSMIDFRPNLSRTSLHKLCKAPRPSLRYIRRPWPHTKHPQTLLGLRDQMFLNLPQTAVRPPQSPLNRQASLLPSTWIYVTSVENVILLDVQGALRCES